MNTEANKEEKSQKSNSSWLGSLWGLVAGVAEEVGKSASQVTQTVVEVAVQTGKIVINTTTNVAETVSNTVSQTGKTAIEMLAQTGAYTVALTMSNIVKTCSIPVFLLPTGSGEQDFICSFCFEEAVKQLQSGIFVRPQLEIWAGHEAIDQIAFILLKLSDKILLSNLSWQDNNQSLKMLIIKRLHNLKINNKNWGKKQNKLYKMWLAASVLVW